MLAALLLMVIAPADPTLFDPATGYRIASYRGVIPGPPPGIRRLNDDEGAKAHDANALFIDFTPAPGAVHDTVSDIWHLAEPHETIPGAHWFPEAGRGTTDPEVDRWLAEGMRRLTHGSRQHAIVAFCLADCWMSWNGSWKLRRLGYRHVTWYANGIDGWKEIGRPLVPTLPESQPAPLPSP